MIRVEKITFGVLSGLRAEFPDDLSIFIFVLENAKRLVCKGVKIEILGDFVAFNQVYAKYFVSNPARSTVAVKTLPKNVLVEVEVLAAK